MTDQEVLNKTKVQSLFDEYGRRIPKDLQAKVCDANRNFRLGQPKLDEEADFISYIMRLHEFIMDVSAMHITVEQLQLETERLLTIIRNDSRVANILNGVYLPVILPQLTTDDLGTALDQYLEGVSKSYVACFSGQELCSYYQDGLANKVSIINGSRHNQLIERMKQGLVIGIHFPNPLQGFSINASREQMSTLPESFILSGIDTFIAMAMYPDILACGSNTPFLDMAALFWQPNDYSFNFENHGSVLGFGNTIDLAVALNNCSGGLLFLPPSQ